MSGRQESQEFEVGGYGEVSEWALETNIVVDCKYYAPCAHARPDGPAYVVPRVVTAKTQGGYDQTSVCADCIREALIGAGAFEETQK